MDKEKLQKFNGLAVSSKFAICGLPIRLDSYKTCAFGCAYCFSNNRKIMEFEKTLQIANIKTIENRLERVFGDGNVSKEDFLDTLISNGITWHCGGMSDPFQPVEGELGVTKDIVDLTNKYGISILFSTKSDKLYDVNVRPDLHSFQLSVSNVSDRKDIEPNIPTIEDRVKLFNDLKREGFKVGIRIQPFIPNVSGIDILETFKTADHFTIEGLKLVPQNKEHKEFLIETLGLDKDNFTQRGLLTLKPLIRLEMYRPLLKYLEKNKLSYSISDNDMRAYGNNRCCCGDALVKKTTLFDTTAMIMDKGVSYTLDDVMERVKESSCENCVCKSLFTSNRTNGCSTVKEFYEERFEKKSSPFSPKFQVDWHKEIGMNK